MLRSAPIGAFPALVTGYLTGYRASRRPSSSSSGIAPAQARVRQSDESFPRTRRASTDWGVSVYQAAGPGPRLATWWRMGAVSLTSTNRLRRALWRRSSGGLVTVSRRVATRMERSTGRWGLSDTADMLHQSTDRGVSISTRRS